ncbi:MAG: hypothetical protein IT290_09255 [Deltaproteobacteria bacterium]|nr:hypothetical protein [Deltaproteobacteria bacterium]
MSEAENHTRFLTGVAGMYPEHVYNVHWRMVREIPVFPLRELVALSVGLEPLFADMGWALAEFERRKLDDHAKADIVNTFTERYVIALRNLAPDGSIPVHERCSQLDNSTVRIEEFAKFARVKGWSLPKEFPQPDAAEGSRLKLDWQNPKIEMLQKIVDSIAENPSKSPPASEEVAHRIDAAFGYESQKGGRPSRSGQTLASLLVPERSRKAGLKHRRTSGSPPRRKGG